MINGNNQSLYNNLVDVLKNKIEKEMKINERLPSERDLSTQYNVSRTTVRLALNELELMGYINRHHGKGTFVSSIVRGKTDLNGTYSFTEQMKLLGKNPKTKILNLKITCANQFVADGLDLPTGSEIIQINRLRIADNEPMMLERTYLPLNKFPGLTIKNLQERPLYDLFIEKYNQNIKFADEFISVGSITVNEAKLLDVFEDDLVLKLQRKTYNQRNEVIEYTLSVARSDKFNYHIRHQR